MSYRLTWKGEGSLDLSQVLDARGVPILLKHTGDACVVNESALQHPLIARYGAANMFEVKNLVTGETYGGEEEQAPAPATPSAPPPAPEPPKDPPADPEPPAPEPPAPSTEEPPVEPPADPPAEPQPDAVMSSADEPSTDAASDSGGAGEDMTKKKGKASGRSSRRSRGK